MKTQVQATAVGHLPQKLMIRVLKLCADRPVRSACLLLLIGVVMLSGPWACLAHCMILDSLDHAHHHHHAHPADSELNSLQGDCGTDLYNTHHPAAEPPSALTFAVLLPLVLLPFLRVENVRFGLNPDVRQSLVHPPPLTPPRRAISPA